MTEPLRSQSVTDRELAEECRQARPDALAHLYRRYAGELLRLGTRITGSRADAEDLLHDLFIGLPELLSRYEERGRLDAWLRGVMTRMSVHLVRKNTRRDRSLEIEMESPDAHDPAARVDIENAIARLPDSERMALVLRHFEGHSHEEIASILGISPGAARVRYVRALRHLKDKLGAGS